MDYEVQEFKISLVNVVKNKEISQAWWQVPVIPATQELRQENHWNLESNVAVSQDCTTPAVNSYLISKDIKMGIIQV